MCVCVCVCEDLTLNNLQWLICHKTQPNKPSATSWICHYDLKQGLGIYSCRPTTCLVSGALATYVKFLELSGTVINLAFSFHTTNSVMAQFELVKHTFPN